MAGASGKSRGFEFVFYEESLPNWRKVFEQLHIPILVSPLHDKDVWTAEDEEENPEHVAGTLKKAHRHGIASWGNPTTLKHALEVFSQIGITYLMPVNSYPAMCRYLCHLDNPEKAQYDVEDIVCINGAVPDLERKLTESEMFAQRDEIMRLCEDNGVVEYADLCDYCRKSRPDWRADVYKHTIFWRGYFASKRSRG